MIRSPELYYCAIAGPNQPWKVSCVRSSFYCFKGDSIRPNRNPDSVHILILTKAVVAGDEKPIDVDGFSDLGQRPPLPRGPPAPPPAPLPGFPSPPPPKRQMARPRPVRIGQIHRPPRLLRCPAHRHLGDLRHLALRKWCPDLEMEDLTQDCSISIKLIGEMEEKIQLLQNALHEIKGSVSDLFKAEDRIHALEEEVQLLLEQSMKNENNIQTLESSADDATENMEVTDYEIKKNNGFKRQLEQAFQLTKMMTSKVLRRSLQKDMNRSRMPSKFATSKVVHFIRGICRFHLPEVNLPDSFFLRASFSKSSMSQAYNQLKLLMSVAQEFHYELQGFIKHEMQMHELTAGLANNLVVFILASTLMIAPIIFAWNVSSSCFSLLKR
ncbi:hypothetical protein MUK42_34221 [Musa troglodytarum]|uniref:Uncharacterized protein n=1 Tax=Musa troglodytarum TaxID=320322 RepID=A0A9E7L7E4_9LILI|nr:hypothetical protein MUK42_34221 [Musa troglodytarum]